MWVVALSAMMSLSLARPIIKVPGMGALKGTLSKGGDVVIFRRIPYAKPPVGDLRWRPPLPYGPWDQNTSEPRESAYFGDACIPWYPVANVSSSEDCLFLNIAAPAAALSSSDHLPVLVYIHGGSYRSGSSHFLNPETLVLGDIPWKPFFGHLGNPWLTFGPRDWSGWLLIGRAIHAVRFSGQTGDSRPISGQI